MKVVLLETLKSQWVVKNGRKKMKKCEKKTCNRGRVRVECARTPPGSKKTECEVSSVVEHILHTDGVISSNLILRISMKALQIIDLQGFFVLAEEVLS